MPTVPSARVFVEGLAACVSEVQVQQHFAKWGPVTHVSFSAAQQGKDCIVTFDSQVDAKRACDQSERVLDGRVSQACFRSL